MDRGRGVGSSAVSQVKPLERGQAEAGAVPSSARPSLPAVIVERGREPEVTETYGPPKRPTRTVDLVAAPDASNEAAVFAAASQQTPPVRSQEQQDPKSPAAFVRQMQVYLAGPDETSASSRSPTISQPADQLTPGQPLVIPGGTNVKMNIPDSAGAASSSVLIDASQTEVARDPAGIERLEVDARANAAKQRDASKRAEQDAAVEQDAVKQAENRRAQQMTEKGEAAQRRAAKIEEGESRSRDRSVDTSPP
jgi:hypothetical protein